MIAFHWQLLYSALDSLGDAQNWWQIWLRYIMQYESVGSHTDAQLAALAFLHKHFQQATMDMVGLMPIDFATELSCQCTGPCNEIVADGLTVSIDNSNLHIIAPFTPSQESTQLMGGSDFRQRVYVPIPAARKLLRTLTLAESKHRLSEVDWETLTRHLQKTHPALRDILVATCRNTDDGDFECPHEWARVFFRALSTNASACVIIKPAQFPLVEQFLKDRSWGSVANTELAIKHLFIFYKLTLNAKVMATQGSSLLDSVVIVVKEMLAVRVFSCAWSGEHWLKSGHHHPGVATYGLRHRCYNNNNNNKNKPFTPYPRYTCRNKQQTKIAGHVHNITVT